MVRALDFYPGGPGSIPTVGVKFFQLCFIPLLRLSCRKTTLQPLWVILCCLLEKGRKEIEGTVDEMKETGREERGTGMKVKKQKK